MYKKIKILFFIFTLIIFSKVNMAQIRVYIQTPRGSDVPDVMLQGKSYI